MGTVTEAEGKIIVEVMAHKGKPVFRQMGKKVITRAVDRVKKAELVQHSCFINHARKPKTIASGI